MKRGYENGGGGGAERRDSRKKQSCREGGKRDYLGTIIKKDENEEGYVIEKGRKRRV
jgi:hypothetical protein